VDILIAVLGARTPAVRERALQNLERLAGQELGPDPTAWEAWWAQHRDGFAAGGLGDSEGPGD
jgi:hypothetical protein